MQARQSPVDSSGPRISSNRLITSLRTPNNFKQPHKSLSCQLCLVNLLSDSHLLWVPRRPPFAEVSAPSSLEINLV